jgi:hypothetical protein
VRLTEKNYAPWVRERQEQLEADVRRTWETLTKTKGTRRNRTYNSFQIKK